MTDLTRLYIMMTLHSHSHSRLSLRQSRLIPPEDRRKRKKKKGTIVCDLRLIPDSNIYPFLLCLF